MAGCSSRGRRIGVRRVVRVVACLGGIAALGAACGREGGGPARAPQAAPRYVTARSASGVETVDVYAATRVGALEPTAARAKPLVYVPNSRSNSVTVIDPAHHAILRTFQTDALPQHVVPAYDLRQLWVANNDGNTLTAIDPVTGAEGRRVAVDDPYNLYYSPDGKFAMVMAERRRRLDLRDPKTMKFLRAVPVNCDGLNHLDFTADDRYAIATCEFSGQLVKIDLQASRPIRYLRLPRPSMPQDVRASPDGRVFYVADMMADGVHLLDPVAFRVIGFVRTGKGAHGIIVGRGGAPFFITNRGWHTTAGGPHGPGSISVLDPGTRRILATWALPGGGSPDMGNISADGKELWVSGRYDREVYVFETATGKLVDRIAVGAEPHGLCVWPQPGRFSLGHTGNMR